MKPKIKPKARKKLRPFRVWIGQVNQTYVDVKAEDQWEAREKGYRAWRRGYAHSNVTGVQQMDLREMARPNRAPVEFENAELGDEG